MNVFASHPLIPWFDIVQGLVIIGGVLRLVYVFLKACKQERQQSVNKHSNTIEESDSGGYQIVE